MRYASILALGLLLACGNREVDPETLAALVSRVPVPAEHEGGRLLYATRCSACHGTYGAGTEQGPPMLHSIQARAHSDFAFRRAIAEGVRPHHYQLGTMPPIPELDAEGIDAIVGYVRWMQQTAGLLPGDG